MEDKTSYFNKVADYYNSDSEEIRLGQINASLEYLNTSEILKKYIRPNTYLLDCAAGTGGYLDIYFSCGCDRIDANDLSDRNVKYMQSVYKNHKNISFQVKNAINLSNYKNNTFDIVVCLGPLYHLHTNDMIQCIDECIRVLKKGGKLIVGYINRYYMLWYLLNNPKYKYSTKEVEFLSKNGYLENGERFLGCAYFSTPEEMENMVVEQNNCFIVEHLALDGCFDLIINRFEKLHADDILAINRMLNNMNYRSVLGASKHNIMVLEKR